MDFPCEACPKDGSKHKGCIGFVLCPDWNAWAQEQYAKAEEEERLNARNV